MRLAFGEIPGVTVSKLAYFTLTLGNYVAALEISDLDNVERLDNSDEDQGIIDPQYVKISPEKKETPCSRLLRADWLDWYCQHAGRSQGTVGCHSARGWFKLQ
jgi:hypothetical protein